MDWRRAVTASQVWWIRASRRKKAVALFLVFVAFLALTQLFGCGRSVSETNERRVAEGGPPARMIQKAQDQVDGAERIKASEPNLSLDVFFDRGILAISASDGDTVILKDGKRLRFSGRCWDQAGATARPRPAQVVLPLEEPSAVFTDRETNKDGTSYLSFTADRLGSWGAGSGTLVLDENDRPVSYTYAVDGSSDDYTFSISYPDRLPELNLKRCSDEA